MDDAVGLPSSVNDHADSLLAALELGPELDWNPQHIAESAWLEHVPFAFWIVKALRPRSIVELGTHLGVSYAAFCQAVDRLQLPTRCAAVDTWTGDHQAGEYGPDVFATVNALNETHWRGFSTLLRMTFNEARGRAGAGEVDLLHIDGLHTYEAVRGDFDTWRDTLSDHGVVMFHDTNVRHDDFGVWRLWQELAAEHPHFEFLHGFGLGILGVGKALPAPVRALFAAAGDPATTARLRSLFAARGRAVRERYVLQRTEALLAGAEQRNRAAEEAAARAHAALAAEHAELGARHEAHLSERATIAADNDALRDESTALRAACDAAATANEALRAENATLRAENAALLAENTTLRAENAALRAEDAALPAESAALRDALARQAVLASERNGLLADRAALEGRIAAMAASTSWRLTRPLRVGLRLLRGDAMARHQLRETMASVLGRASPAQALPATAGVQAETPAVAVAGLRVVWLSGEASTPGHQYRVVRWAEAARASGAKVSVATIEQVATVLDDIATADILVIWRATWGKPVERAVGAARAAGARIIFDVDDLMFDPTLARIEIIDGIRSQVLTEEAVAAMYRLVQRTAEWADICTATTEELAQHFRRMQKPALVLPNGFDEATLATSRLAVRRRRAQPEDGLLRIGYAGGSRTHQRDFGLCVEALARVLHAMPQARLVLFCEAGSRRSLVELEEFPALADLGAQVEWRTLVPLERLPDELARFDVNLAPLEPGNPFCEAKSELKYFEAALAGVCTVASPTGPYSRAIRDGETGFLAADTEAWHDAIRRLLEQPELRARMARAALHDVLWAFGPERRVELAASALEQFRGGRSAARAFALELRREPARAPLPTVPETRTAFASDRLGTADVTVIVPLHNYANYVEEALRSVAAQTLAALDLVVVDDASTDDSLAVAVDWARRNEGRFNRLLVLQNLRNSKLGPTRNAGFDAAETAYVLPLDADNRLLPRCAEDCLAAIRAQQAAFAYPVIRHFGAASSVMGNLPFDPARLVGGNYIDAMALIAKSAWCVAGGYDDVRFGWEDYDFWCRLAERGLHGAPVGGAPLAEYRVHEASMLRQVTEMPDNKRQLVEDFERRHPWTTIAVPFATAGTPTGAVTGRDHRLDYLLPVLRCPETGQRLLRGGAGELRTEDGSRIWPIVEGCPVLFPGLANPEVRPPAHVSNVIPDHILARMQGTEGLVLNLSAGGTLTKPPNVVEAEVGVFRNTDLIADAHRLPFQDRSFAGVLVMNAFEHYADPPLAAREILRVLRPGGWVLVRTAFLQPVHEAPWHFYNCTKYGLLRWFEGFETENLQVSENFNPSFSLAWIASEAEAALRQDVSPAAAAAFAAAPIGQLVGLWRDEGQREANPVWQSFRGLSQESQERIAAGFELVARRPAE